jgi:hypothetical protein
MKLVLYGCSHFSREEFDDDDLVQSQEGFSWSNMLGMVMQLLFNPPQGPNKSDSLDTDHVSSRGGTSR